MQLSVLSWYSASVNLRWPKSNQDERTKRRAVLRDIAKQSLKGLRVGHIESSTYSSRSLGLSEATAALEKLVEGPRRLAEDSILANWQCEEEEFLPVRKGSLGVTQSGTVAYFRGAIKYLSWYCRNVESNLVIVGEELHVGWKRLVAMVLLISLCRWCCFEDRTLQKTLLYIFSVRWTCVNEGLLSGPINVGPRCNRGCQESRRRANSFHQRNKCNHLQFDLSVDGR